MRTVPKKTLFSNHKALRTNQPVCGLHVSFAAQIATVWAKPCGKGPCGGVWNGQSARQTDVGLWAFHLVQKDSVMI